MNQAKHILVTAPLGVGGITSMMINIQKNIDRDKINFDYLVLHDRHEDLEDVVIKMGSQKLIASADEINNKWHRGFVRWYRLYRVYKGITFKWWSRFGYDNGLYCKIGGSKTCYIS